MTKTLIQKKKRDDRCNAAVAATAKLSQQNALTTPTANPAKKTYRVSTVSCTMRVPNELVPEITKLIATYRAQRRDDPDTWD